MKQSPDNTPREIEPFTGVLELPELSAIPTDTDGQYLFLRNLLFREDYPVQTATRSLSTEEAGDIDPVRGLPRDIYSKLLIEKSTDERIVTAAIASLSKKPVSLIIQLRSLFIVSYDRKTALQLTSTHNTPSYSSGSTERISVDRYVATQEGLAKDGDAPFAYYLGPGSEPERFRFPLNPTSSQAIRDAIHAFKRQVIAIELANGTPTELKHPFRSIRTRV